MRNSPEKIATAAMALGFLLLLVTNCEVVTHSHWSRLNVTIGEYLDTAQDFEWRYPYLGELDAMYWTNYAMRMVEEGRFRIRHTDIDNAPYGREVHWASLNLWWMVLLGGITAVATGQSWVEGVASAAPWSNPILLATGLCGLGLLLGRRFGWPAATFFLFAGQLLLRIYFHFQLGAPDHHGWQVLFLTAHLIFLVLLVRGDPQNPGPETRPHSLARDAALSGFFGGCMLWIGATQAAVLLAVSGASVAILLCYQKLLRPETPPRVPAETWLIWGFSGALTSFVFYLVEYAPDHLSLHLEVNHPLYACSLAAGGMLLFGGQRLLFPQPGQKTRLLVLLLTAAFLVALFPALLILLTRDPAIHAMMGPVMHRLHDFLEEFNSALTGKGAWLTKREYGLLLLGALTGLGLVLAKARKADPADWQRLSALGIAAVMSTVLLVISAFQDRWMSLAAVSALVTLVLILTGPRISPKIPGWSFVAVWTLVAIICHALALVRFSNRTYSHDLQVALNKFHGLAQAHRVIRETLPPGQEEAVVLLYPLKTQGYAQLGFTDGISVVASQYWENAEGNRDAFAILGSLDREMVRELLAKRGVTHLVLRNREDTVIGPMYFWNGETIDFPERAEMLSFQLAAPRANPPDWVTLVDEIPVAMGEYFRIYKVDLGKLNSP